MSLETGQAALYGFAQKKQRKGKDIYFFVGQVSAWQSATLLPIRSCKSAHHVPAWVEEPR